MIGRGLAVAIAGAAIQLLSSTGAQKSDIYPRAHPCYPWQSHAGGRAVGRARVIRVRSCAYSPPQGRVSTDALCILSHRQ